MLNQGLEIQEDYDSVPTFQAFWNGRKERTLKQELGLENGKTTAQHTANTECFCICGSVFRLCHKLFPLQQPNRVFVLPTDTHWVSVPRRGTVPVIMRFDSSQGDGHSSKKYHKISMRWDSGGKCCEESDTELEECTHCGGWGGV